MTINELSQYKDLLKEIEEQELKLQELKMQPIPRIMAGQVKSSRKEFPYTETRLLLGVEDEKAIKAKYDCIIIKERRISEARELAVKIEEYIRGIKDSELRRIFEMRYKDGYKVREIAEFLNMDRSTVGKKIMKYLKVSPNSPK